LDGLTIDQTVDMINLLLVAGVLIAAVLGWIEINRARRLPFFLLRRERISRGWRILLLAALLGASAVVVRLFGRPAAYIIMQPTPSNTPTATKTHTPTITMTPTITLTPSISPTPTITGTPTPTTTPQIPDAITVLFSETVTPNPEAVFSPVEVSDRIDSINRAIDPGASWSNPLQILFGAFTYDFLEDGVRWTAIWYLENEVVCVESEPWTGGTGGYGYTECSPASGWEPGDYEIQLFLGEEWKISTRFTVLGNAVTSTSTIAPSDTPES
jgi:hypothetical protein